MLLFIVSELLFFVAAASSTTGDIVAALEADDMCMAKGNKNECALELAQLRAAVLPSKKSLSLAQIDQSDADVKNHEDQLSEEASELAAKIHKAAEDSAKLKQEAALLRAELQAFTERRAAAEQKAVLNAGVIASAKHATAQVATLAKADLSNSAKAELSKEESLELERIQTEKAEARVIETNHFADKIESSQLIQHKANIMTALETRRLCLPERVLNFSTALVTHSNLGGMGPDDGAETLVYQGLATKDDQSVDMIVTAASPYTPNDALKNGIHGGHFGILNLKVNSDVNLTFRFVNRLGAPVLMDPFFLTFYDIDQGMSHGSRESISVFGFDQFKISEDTELNIVPLGDDAGLFQSTLRGGKVDNPTHPRFLTEVEEERTVVFTMPETSEFQVSFSESDYADIEQGRNFLFSGPSSMVCGREHLCIDFICQPGYHIRTMAEFLVCDGRRCEEKDRDTCCYEIPEGIEGHVPRSELA